MLNPRKTFPTVSVGGGDGRVSNNRGSTKAMSLACSIYCATCLSKGRRTEAVNGVSKVDRKPPFCMTLVFFTMTNFFFASVCRCFLYFRNVTFCLRVNGTFPFNMLYVHSHRLQIRSTKALARMSFLEFYSCVYSASVDARQAFFRVSTSCE